MATNFLTKLFGSRNDRLLKQYRKTVTRINAMEPDYEKLSDEQLKAKTQEFKERVAKGESLDDILPEAFAVVREGSKRIMKMRHFDVQLLGGMALHFGKISEMRTGEGKTLTATLPVYLNALSGKGVHVVTVNDYLANRDAQWMGRLYNFLGLTVGINLPNMPREQKQEAYRADITYGTNNEYGFDYLRDNMVYEAQDRVQQGLNAGERQARRFDASGAVARLCVDHCGFEHRVDVAAAMGEQQGRRPGGRQQQFGQGVAVDVQLVEVDQPVEITQALRITLMLMQCGGTRGLDACTDQSGQYCRFAGHAARPFSRRLKCSRARR